MVIFFLDFQIEMIYFRENFYYKNIENIYIQIFFY